MTKNRIDNEKYQKLLNEIGFKLNKKVRIVPESGLYIAIGELNLRDVIIKIVPRTEVHKVHGFYKEALVDDIMEKNNRDLSRLLILKARVLAVGQNGDLAWIIRRYYPGMALSISKNEKLLFIDRLSTIEKKYLVGADIYKQIVQNICSLQSMSVVFRKSSIRKDTFSRRFRDNLDDYNREKIETGLDVILDRQYDIFEKNKKLYFDKKNIVACTGDLTPANIILRKDGQVIFSDFEWFCLDNQTVDIAFLWLFLHKRRRWQKFLLESLLKNKEDRINFQVSVIRILFYWFDNVFENDQPTAQSLENRKRYKKHIWLRYLVAAGESFEALINVK